MDKMQVPVYTDTEAETSVDMDASLKDIMKIQKTNFTKSVFNITLTNFTESQESADFREHERKLQAEIREWRKVWMEAKQQLKAMQNAKEIVDISTLPAQKRAYLQQAPDLQRFIRNSLEFRKAANVFLRVDLAETLEMEENLLEICEYRLGLTKENKIKELLSNVETVKKMSKLSRQ